MNLYTSRDIKEEARAQLQGYWKQVIILMIIPSIFSIFFLSTTVEESLNQSFGADLLDLILNVIHSFLLTGSIFTLLDFVRRKDNLDAPLKSVVQAFRNEYFVGLIKVKFLTYLYTFLWTLLLIIPGIVKGYSYTQAERIYKDTVDQTGIQPSARECLSRSQELMMGHKMRLFRLNFSFIGWIMLSVFTLGIGLIWLIPYMEMSDTIFYVDLAGDWYNDEDTEEYISDEEWLEQNRRENDNPNEEVGKDPDDFSDFDDF